MFYIGVDLGKRRDFTAIAVVEKSEAVEERFEHVPWMQKSYPVDYPMVVRYLERMPLGTAYTEVTARLVRLVRDPALGRWRKRLVVDATGVGNPVVDMLQAARPGCEVMPVILTGGDRQKSDGRVWHVPTVDLLGELQAALERRELRIARAMRETEQLVRELGDIRMTAGQSGRVRVGADGAGEHDDLVIAVALACWAGRRTGARELPGRLFW